MRCPVSCTIRSRAKRFAVSTNDGAHAVAAEALEQGGEARALLDGIGALDRGVIELVDDRVAGTPGEGVDRVALALVAVLVGANVGGRARPQVGDRLDPFLGHFIARSVRFEPESKPVFGETASHPHASARGNSIGPEQGLHRALRAHFATKEGNTQA
jgi:hypothetical protein